MASPEKIMEPRNTPEYIIARGNINKYTVHCDCGQTMTRTNNKKGVCFQCKKKRLSEYGKARYIAKIAKK